MPAPKILQIVEAFGGGVFYSVTQTCNLLAQTGCRVQLIYSLRPEAPANFIDFLDPSIKLISFPMRREISLAADLCALRQIMRQIYEFQPDIIHLHSSKAGALGRVAAKLTRYHHYIFYSPRGLSFLRTDVSPIKRCLFGAIEFCLARLGGTLVACSESELWKIRHQLHTRRCVLIENAVPTAHVLEKIHGDSRGRPLLVGTVGRITPAKNPELFSRMADALLTENVHMRWIGGDDHHQYETRLRKAGVEISGWLSREQVYRELIQLDVYLQTSFWEGMPVSVIEAQVAGIPCVVTDVVGNRDVVHHGITGFVAKNEIELIAYIRRLMVDSDLRRQMGRQARLQALQRFSLDRLQRELLQLYKLQYMEEEAHKTKAGTAASGTY